MRLIAGRTAQEYNQRKGRQVAFWEDRYHATAIEIDEHLHRCHVYIDLNMVRAGAVTQPSEWAQSGYRGIQEPPQRYAIMDLRGLKRIMWLCGSRDFQPNRIPESCRGEIIDGWVRLRLAVRRSFIR